MTGRKAAARISRDITTSNRSGKERADYVQRLELAARATNDVLWDWDLVSNAIWWGAALERLFQYRRSDIERTIDSWTTRIHPDEAQRVVTEVQRAIDHGATFWNGEYRFRRADGTYADVYDRGYIMRDRAGRPTRMIGAMMDISERKREQQALKNERALLRTIIDVLPDYIYVKDVEGRFKLGNKAWLDARRLQRDEVEGRTVFDVFPPALARTMHAQDQAIMASGEAVLDQDQEILLRDAARSSRRWSSTSKVPMHDEQGRVIGVVGISRDITARRRLERERAVQHAISRVLAEATTLHQTMTSLIQTVCSTLEWAYGARWEWSSSGKLVRREWWSDFDVVFDPADEARWLELAPDAPGGLVRRAWIEQKPVWIADVTKSEQFRRQPSCSRFDLLRAMAFPIIAHNTPVGVLEFFGREAREPDTSLMELAAAVGSQIGQFIARKQAEEALQQNEQQLRAMFEHADIGIAITGLDGRYIQVNDRYCSIVGYSREELSRMAVADVNTRENVAELVVAREQLLHSEVSSRMIEKQLLRKDGSLIWVSISISVVRASDGSPLYYLGVLQDISESKRASAALKESEERFRQLAQYDSLTGLPNRALYYERLKDALAHARRNATALAVLFIDVDRFKYVNDTLGHAAGDELLKQVAQRLSECLRSDDTVGRLSGDEFALVLSRLSAAEDAALVARKIVEQLNRPFSLEGTEIFVTASIGITVYPDDGAEHAVLLRNADIAMYQAKDRGRNNYQFFTADMNKRTRDMLQLDGELRHALERDEFVLHYQPKVSLATRRIVGLEALLRWNHPQRGLVPPGDFIPLLEETGLIAAAGDWVLRAACSQLKAWQRTALRGVPIAINLSARQFLARDLASRISRVLEEYAVEPALLEFELTESSIMANPEDAVTTLELMQAMGVGIAVDDFGTGYSSLSYLKRFPIRALKVDRSFVRDITSDADDAAITQAVVSMAHSLGMNVIAEGVETPEQLALLVRFGCDEVQGYLFARPMPAAACAELLAADRPLVVPDIAAEALRRAG